MTGCGIGNVVLIVAARSCDHPAALATAAAAAAGGVMARVRVRIDIDVDIDGADGILAGIRSDAIELELRSSRSSRSPSAAAVDDDDEDDADLSKYCNLSALARPETIQAMRRIVIVPDGLEEIMRKTFRGVQAGFCIRTSDEAYDGACRFMNDRARATMIALMSRYERVFVCSNDVRNLENLPSNALVFEKTGDDDDDDDRSSKRNALSHWMQWHVLARCPVVFHGVSGRDGSITSTFGSTAAFYGGGIPVGVDNDGNVFATTTTGYRW